jgi:8-oxo-dGTP pyrophosphatase MutT (NUDIX family)
MAYRQEGGPDKADKVELCNNCGKYGHLYKHCKVPITSFGVIVFRTHPEHGREYLMIRRKDTLGYIDFMRGKYHVNDSYYILNMMVQMTQHEKQGLLDHPFETLWCRLWNVDPDTSTPSLSKQYKSEEAGSKAKFNLLKARGTLHKLIQESNRGAVWEEPEWGFPKGRRNYQEKDYECALREMTEETGFPVHKMKNIKNILPYEEIFLGSNYKSYKHKYYLMFMDFADTVNMSRFDHAEVSDMKWKTFEQCMTDIRSYNVEKKRILTHIEYLLRG